MDFFNKEELSNELNVAFSEFTTFLESHSEETINLEIIEGKWTMAQHLYHLVKSTKATSKGLGMPKMMLKTMFGKNNRDERTYSELTAKYKAKLAESNLKAPPEYSGEGRTFGKAAILKRFDDELQDLQRVLAKWKEEDLSVYVLPHPAIGKLTIREMIYFTILHTRHHLGILEKQYVPILDS